MAFGTGGNPMQAEPGGDVKAGGEGAGGGRVVGDTVMGGVVVGAGVGITTALAQSLMPRSVQAPGTDAPLKMQESQVLEMQP